MVENKPPHTSAPPRPSPFGWPEALIWGGFLGAGGTGLAALAISGAEIWTLDYWGEDRSAVLRNLGLLILAMPALWLAWRRTSTATKQAAISERGLQIDRYQKGAQMLESDELSVRIAGISGLRELALSDPEESYIIVQSLLFAFIREKSKTRRVKTWKATPGGAKRLHPIYEPLGADVYEAFAATKALREAVPNAKCMGEARNWQPDLRFANLSNTVFRRANLPEAILSNANLSSTNLGTANLSGARLHKTNLSGAKLRNANLSGAKLGNANLSGAKLGNVNLSGAGLSDIKSDAATDFSGVWAWRDRPPIDMPQEIQAAITYRDPAEREEND